jgi:histone H3/H4
MVQIERIYARKKRIFHIYTQKEADRSSKLTYKPWKQVNKGEFALTDDGYVSECLDRKDYTDKNGSIKTFVKLSCGVGWVTPSAQILFELNHAHKSYSKTNPRRTWDMQEIKSRRGKDTIDTYAQMKLTGAVNYSQLGKIYRPDSKIPEATVKRFLKNKKVKMEVEKKVKEILMEKSISKEYAVDNLVKALAMAEHKGDVGNFLKANDQIMDLLEMKPNKAITTDTVELIDTTKLLDQITKEEQRKVVMQRKEEKDERQV